MNIGDKFVRGADGLSSVRVGDRVRRIHTNRKCEVTKISRVYVVAELGIYTGESPKTISTKEGDSKFFMAEGDSQIISWRWADDYIKECS